MDKIELDGLELDVFSYSERLVPSEQSERNLLQINFGVHLLGQTWNQKLEEILLQYEAVEVRRSGIDAEPILMRVAPDDKSFLEGADSETVLYHYFITLIEAE